MASTGANQGRREWHIKLLNTRTKRFVDDDTGKFQIYTAGSAARPTIFNSAGASATQEVVGTSYLSQTMTDATLTFYTARSVSAVDVSILTAGGRAYFLDGLNSSEHRIDVDPDQTEWVLCVAFDDRASATTIRPLGFQLRPGMVVKDLVVNVKAAFTGAAATAATYDFGRSGDPNGLIDGLTLSAITLKRLQPISTTGIIAAAQIVGLDLEQHQADVSTTNLGYFTRHPYVPVGTITGVASNNLVLQRVTNLTASFTAAAASAGSGYVYYMYTLLPAIQTGI